MNPITFFLLIAAFNAFAAEAPAANNAELIEAAKKERDVVFYTTTNLEEAVAMSGHFKAKYPFLDVNINRAEGERLVSKVLQETRARKSLADVMQTPAFYLHALKKRGILGEYTSTEERFFPRNFKEEKSWTTTYYNPYVVLYNTKLVSAQNLPRRYDDLLNPLEKQNDRGKRQDRLVHSDATYFGSGKRPEIYERPVEAGSYAANRADGDNPIGGRR
jgi:spermidine/putrescine-binding protein